MKTKIVMVVEAMLGGIRQHVCDIIKNLNQEYFQIYLIYSDLRADDIFFKEKDLLSEYATLIRCNDMQRELGKQDIRAYNTLVRLFDEIQPDIVHCHSSKAGIVGRMADKKCSIKKIIYTPNAYSFQNPDISSIKKQIYIVAERILSRHATTMTINVSKGEMQQAISHKVDKENKFTLIYNGIPQIELPDKNYMRDKLNLCKDRYYVGVTARCAQQKDPMTFLNIAEKIIAKMQNVEFIYIGDGPMQQEMKQWITEKNLENKIHMLGFRTDAAEIVGVLDIYLSTALYEGLPYSMIEAMRAGIPLIATDVVGNNEIVADGINGILFPAKDIKAGANAVIRQIEAEQIKKKNVVKSFEERYSLKHMLNSTEYIYELCVGAVAKPDYFENRSHKGCEGVLFSMIASENEVAA